MKENIEKWLSNNHSSIFEYLQFFVGIPSENLYPNGNELQAQLAMERWMQELGFVTDRFLPTDVEGIEQHEAFLDDGRSYASRPNLVGVLKGTGRGKSLLFSGHMDTVPVDPELWTCDPFAGKIEAGRLYGAGCFDMKGGMIAAMLAVKCLQELGCEMAGDLMVEFVVDEEFGGANGTLACRLRGYEADAAIIPEPTNLMICPVNQGGAYYRITFHGKAGRSYSGESLLNPISAAARCIPILEQYHIWRNQRTVHHPLFQQKSLPTLIQRIQAGHIELDLADRVPDKCSLDVWIQVYPGVTEKQLLDEFIAFYQPLADADEVLSLMPIHIEKKIRFLPGTGMDESHPILQILKDAGKEVFPQGLSYGGAPFACDSFMFNMYAQTPAVIIGPSGGNAHAPDEYIETEDYMRLIMIYALVILDWCGLQSERS